MEVQERDPPIPVTDQELDLLRRSVTAEPAPMGAPVEGMSSVTEIPYVSDTGCRSGDALGVDVMEGLTRWPR